MLGGGVCLSGPTGDPGVQRVVQGKVPSAHSLHVSDWGSFPGSEGCAVQEHLGPPSLSWAALERKFM